MDILPRIAPRLPTSRLHRAACVGSSALMAMSNLALGLTPAAAMTDACYTLEPGQVGSVDHPTEPGAIVLRMFVGGGFVPREIAFIEAPQFTLYGNDVAIFGAPVAPDAALTDPRPPFQCLRLSPDQVDELLTFALTEGGLADAGEEYPNPNITDVPSTVFTIDAAGVDKTVSVFALGFERAPEDQLEDRARFQALATLLGDFGEGVEGEEPFHVLAYASLLEEALDDSATEPAPWPWPELTPADFAAGEVADMPVALTSDQVGAVTVVPNGGQVLIPISGPDGAPLSLAIRPILP